MMGTSRPTLKLLQALNAMFNVGAALA